MVGSIADEGEPAVRQHDRVEFIAVKHHQPPAVGGGVKSGARDLHAAEVHSREGTHHLVVIARDVDDPGAAPRPLEDPPDDVVVLGGPVDLLLQPPAVDDVADQIHRLAVGVVEEVDQQIVVAPLGAQMDVADPDGAEFPPLAADALGHGRRDRGETGHAMRGVELAGRIVHAIASLRRKTDP